MKDLQGKRFGRLIALRVDGHTPRGEIYWLCQCDCGQSKRVLAGNILAGRTHSCGCLHREITAARFTTHGDTTKKGIAPEFNTWAGMIARCYNPKDRNYPRYGARGITVCERWRAYLHFAEDMGRKPTATHTLDRIDFNGNYEPGNCRWATPKEQARNRRTNLVIEYDGRRMTLAEWSERTGLQSGTIWSRLDTGWLIDKALSAPLRSQKPRRRCSADRQGATG